MGFPFQGLLLYMLKNKVYSASDSGTRALTIVHASVAMYSCQCQSIIKGLH